MIMVGFLSEGCDFAVFNQDQGHAVVRALQAVDHAAANKVLEQFHDLFVVKIAFFILDHLGGDVAHDGKIPHISTGATMIPEYFRFKKT
jgi:hypothetical protein